MAIVERLGLAIPLIQAPMAGVSTPALAAAVSNEGALGCIAVGSADAAAARDMIQAVRAQTGNPFGVNLFVHGRPAVDPAREAVWLDWLAPTFREFGAEPPARLRAPYRSFDDDPDMLEMLLEAAPPLVSFHFGIPPAEWLAALRGRGICLIATATSPAEARMLQAAGLDAVVAQGIEAGGHRGTFDPDAPDEALGTAGLVHRLLSDCHLPVIAAGGIMGGAGIAGMLRLGACAAQLGTAFIACPESAADEAYRAALAGPGAHHTLMTSLVSGRPARSLPNRFTALSETVGRLKPPAYPLAYDAGKALNAAARARGEHGFGAQWAGTGAPLAREMPAAALVQTLIKEMRDAGWRETTGGLRA